MRFFEWFSGLVGGNRGRASPHEVSVQNLCKAAEEYRLRELAFWSCCNLISNALGRCDFRTYRNNREIRGPEYYGWNLSPNLYQNSTAFLHKLVAQLYQENEALIVYAGQQNGADCMHIADVWDVPDPQILRESEYTGVTVGSLAFNRVFTESEVLHLKLNHVNIQPVIDGIYRSYVRLIQAAMDAYTWDNGNHWKVHVDQVPDGEDGWNETFAKMIQDQIRPFLQSGAAVLPELDGYDYQQIKGGGNLDGKGIRGMVDDVFDFTANAFLIPPVLLRGQVEGTKDAVNRFLTACIDPLADQIAEEVNRKRYGYDLWKRGTYMSVDTSGIQHIDLIENAANIEKLLGSGFSFNDVQKALNRPELSDDWAKEHFITRNFAKVEDLLKEGTN